MIEITFTDLFIFITVLWIALRAIFAIKNKRIDIKNELKLLTIYICIVVISRFVYFPLGLENGHIKPLVFDAERIVPFRMNFVPIIHMFDDYDGWLINIIGNVTMFIPVGICCPLCFKQLDTIWKTILAGAASTLFIEISQLLFYNRCTDIDDLIMNTTGVIIGAAIFFVIRNIIMKHKDESVQTVEAV